VKIALVHDYLAESGGAERVLGVLAEMYPSAVIYTAFVRRGSRAERAFRDRTIIESPWAWLLKLPRMHSYLRFLLPAIWQSVDLSEYELVITSCSGYIARGFQVGKKTRIVAYCHTPPKWLYYYETPTQAAKKWWGKMYLTVFGPFLRYFDYQSAQRVDTWIANSREVAGRIRKFYRKKAVCIYPPVILAKPEELVREEYYLVVARLVGAKGIELAALACRALNRELVVVGEGEKNKEPGVRYTGWVEDKELARLYRQARGYLALAKDEDFGMTVVEAIAEGTPVVAFDSGGYKETVIPGKTGVVVEWDHKSSKAIVARVVEGMKELEKTKWEREGMKRWAKKFGRERFEREIRRIVGA